MARRKEKSVSLQDKENLSRKSSIKVWRKVRKLNASAGFCTPKLPFARLVRQILQSLSLSDIRVEYQALVALQEAYVTYEMQLQEVPLGNNNHLCLSTIYNSQKPCTYIEPQTPPATSPIVQSSCRHSGRIRRPVPPKPYTPILIQSEPNVNKKSTRKSNQQTKRKYQAHETYVMQQGVFNTEVPCTLDDNNHLCLDNSQEPLPCTYMEPQTPPTTSPIVQSSCRRSGRIRRPVPPKLYTPILIQSEPNVNKKIHKQIKSTN